jgi:hypothetical protein
MPFSFPPTSRYAGIPILTLPGEEPIPYLARRLVPLPERFATLKEHVVAERERLDQIAAAELGDPEAFWRLADANGALRPQELTATPGRRLRVTLPEGLPGA